MNRPHRAHPAWWAFAVHRASGLALTLFVPLHFWALGTAIGGEAALDGMLRWTDNAFVKFAETGIVVLLAAHMAGGMRLLAVEFLPWSGSQKTAVAASAGVAFAAGLLFLFNLGAT